MRATKPQKPIRPWAVQEGTASEVAPQLRNKNSEVLAFVAEGEDPQTRTKFEILKRLSYMIDSIILEQDTKKWNAIIETLTPDVPLSDNRLIEARMLADAKRSVLESQEFVSAQKIAKVAEFSDKNPSSQPNRWKRAGLIFAVPYKGLDLYPSYALDWAHGAKPLPIMSRILKLFSDKDDWQKAFWFGSLNSYLEDRMPKDLLKSQPEQVLKAAEIEAIGVHQG
jgi:hypothetical protein